MVYKVGAIQGDSVRDVNNDILGRKYVNDLLGGKSQAAPTILAHDNAKNALQSILKNGPVPGGGWKSRNDVHFAPLPNDISLKRFSEGCVLGFAMDATSSSTFRRESRVIVAAWHCR
jgi:hypothetical protein